MVKSNMFKRSACLTVTVIFLTTTFLAVTAAGCCCPVSSPTTSTLPPPSTSPEATATIAPSQNQQPIEVTAVFGPLPPINPGGPVVEIILKNVSLEPVVSLTATLEAGGSYVFDFGHTPSTPLLPGQTTVEPLRLIGGGFSENLQYPLTINATLQSGARFVYTQKVQIVRP